MLELKVQDNGIGIPKELIEKIFDRFFQRDTSRTRKYEGTGIGLSLVKELVELHQGKIYVESQPGNGSCFTILLPLLLADYKQITVGDHNIIKEDKSITLLNAEETVFIRPSKPIITEAEINIPLVLIVEDNADIRAYIHQHLYPLYQVIEAADGEEGFTAANETIPDLILSDVMMPVMDGIELCRKLKNNEKTAHIPVILLTAKASGGDKIEGLEKGADDYILKPFEVSELMVRIKNLIDSRKKLREHFSRQISLEPASISITSLDEQFLKRVMNIIEDHMSDPSFSVDVFSRESGMSKTQLHRKIKALTNESPGDLIKIIRLKRAVELLLQGGGTIAEVAYIVGFQEPSYFTRCFQKQYGKTPSEFMATGSVQSK
ncbi:hypothetical protein BH23BAC1_BH23BAC1_49980 [soil metagenome]